MSKVLSLLNKKAKTQHLTEKVESGSLILRLSFIQHLLFLGLYSLLTLTFVWPVLPHLGVVTPGDFPVDRNQYLWNMWWFRHALLDLGTNPFHTDLLYHPYGTNLFVHAFSPLGNLMGLPFQIIFGTIPAYGIVELLTFPLAGYGAFLLVHHLTRNIPAAFCSGLIYSFCAYHYFELKYEQLNLIAIQWIPLYILFWLKAVEAKSWRLAVRVGWPAALFAIFTGLTDWYYLTYLALFSGGYTLWRLWSGVAEFRRVVIRLAAIWLVTGLALSYLILGILVDSNSDKLEPTSQSGQELTGSADLLNLWLPPNYHPLWGQSAWGSITLNRAGAVLPYFGLALAVAGFIWRRRETQGWLVGGVGFLVLAFGPNLYFGGNNLGVPLPYRLLAGLPFFNIGRFPERYILMVNLTLAVAGGYGLAAILSRLQRVGWKRLAVVAVCGLVFLESWPGFLPVSPPIGPFPFTDYVKAANGRVAPELALLELPITKHFTSDSNRMLYQTYHSRPILGGYLSRKVIDLYRFGPPYPLYDFLDLRGFERDIVPPHTPEEWRGLLNLEKIGYVVVYPDELGKDQLNRIGQMLPAVFGKGVQPDFKDNTAQVYAVPAGKLEKPVLTLGWGWYNLEDIGGGKVQRWINLERLGEAQVIITIGPEAEQKPSYTLQFEAVSFAKPYRVDVFLNGQKVGETQIDGLGNFKVANLNLKRGTNLLSFRPDPAGGSTIPANVIPKSQDSRPLTVALLKLEIS